MTDMWTVDLCRDWQRIGYVADPTFDGVERLLEAGEWQLTITPDQVAFGSYFDPADLASFQPGYADFPGQASDNLTISRTAPTSLTTLEFRCRIRLASTAALYVFGGWVAGTAALYVFTDGRISVFVNNNAAGIIGNALSSVPYPGYGVGTDICLRGKVTVATATCEYFYSTDVPALDDPMLNRVTWTTLGTPVVGTNAGTTPDLSSSGTPIIGDYLTGGGFPVPGRCYNWVELDDGQPTVVVDMSHDFADAASTSFVATSGQTVTVNRSGSPATALVPATPIELVSWKPEDINTIRLVRNNTLAFGGYVEESSEGSGGFEKVIDGNGERWTWSGPDLWDDLKSRVAYPTPATEPTWAASHDTNTGVASTVLTSYLNDNLGSSAITARQIPGFVVDDQVVGMSDTWTARLQPLDELVKRICNDAGLVCRLTVDFNGAITATIGLPRDLSGRFVVSDQGDLSTLQIRHVPPTATKVIAGGTGTGASRNFQSSDSGATGRARREQFLDLSSLNSSTEVAAAAATARFLASGTYSVYAELTDLAASELRYGDDYVVGESLAVQVETTRFVVPVTEAAFEINATRQVIRPTLGTAIPDSLRGLLRRLALVETRGANTIA